MENIIAIVLSAIVGLGTTALSLYKGSHGVLQDDIKSIKADRDYYHKQMMKAQDDNDRLYVENRLLKDKVADLTDKLNEVNSHHE